MPAGQRRERRTLVEHARPVCVLEEFPLRMNGGYSLPELPFELLGCRPMSCPLLSDNRAIVIDRIRVTGGLAAFRHAHPDSIYTASDSLRLIALAGKMIVAGLSAASVVGGVSRWRHTA